MSIMRQLSRIQWISLILVIGILFIDMLLYSIFIPVAPYFVTKYKMSSTMVGVLFGSYAAALFITTPFFGKMTDRVGRCKTMMTGLVFMLFSTLLFIFSQTTIMLICARFLQGLAAAASWTAALALLADLFDRSIRGTVMGFAMGGISAGSLLGAPTGGWLFEVGDYRTPFLVAALITLLILVAVWGLLREPVRSSKALKGGSVFSLLCHRTVFFIACIILLAETTLTMLEPLISMYVTKQFQLSPLLLGVLFGVMTISYASIAPIVGTLTNKYNPFWLMLVGIIGLALSLPFIVLASNVLWLMGVSCFIGTFVGLTLVPTLPTLGAIVDQGALRGDYGVAYALVNMIHAAGMMLGPFVGGVLTDRMPVMFVLIIFGVMIIVGAIGLALFTYQHHNLFTFYSK